MLGGEFPVVPSAGGEAKHGAVRFGLCRHYGVAGDYGDFPVHPAAQPGGPRRAERGAGTVDTDRLRQVAEQLRVSGVKPRRPPRTQPRLWFHEPLHQRPVWFQRFPVPRHTRLSHHHLHDCSALVQQGGGLERRLAGADDDDALATEGAQVDVCRTMGARGGGQRGQRLRHMGEVLDTCGDDHRAGGGAVAVREAEFVMAVVPGQLGDGYLLEIGHEVGTKPLAVGNEGVQWNRQAVMRVRMAGLGAECLQRVRALRIRDVRGEALRFKEHSAWHRRPPRKHRQAELAETHTRPAKMRGERQPVRTRAYDRGVGTVDGIVHAG